ncbi:MAG: hypothetical protein ACREVL_18515 [Solimonas sp.]
MPSVRIVSWNSGGEAAGRQNQLVTAVNFFNATAPPVDLVTIQEAAVRPGGVIRARLGGGVVPFNNFAPPDHVREQTAAQTFQVARSKAYLIAWAQAGPGALVPGPAAQLVSLAPVQVPAPNGVAQYIAGLSMNGMPLSPRINANLLEAAGNIRAPVRKTFTVTVAGVLHTLYFYTWHGNLQSQWGNATYLQLGLTQNPFTVGSEGMYPAFMFLQQCNRYQADLAAVNANQSDVLIVAGDLNISVPDVTRSAALVFPGFDGASDNLSHILAFSKSPNLVIAQDDNFGAPPGHNILTAEVQW